MAIIATTAVRRAMAMKGRLRILQGGSSAGKSLAVLLVLIHTAQKTKGKLISIVSESFPHLKRGVMRDFIAVMEEQGYYKDNSWNRTDSIYTFETGSKIEFFSADQSDKVRGPRRDILFINEANNIGYETYTQLAIRTKDYIFIDYNPVSEFFVHTEILPKSDPGTNFQIFTYKDNEALSPVIVQELESRRGNKNWALVYLDGQLGAVEGRIYTNWAIIDEIPHEARLVRRGLDFGYSNDPAALVDIYYYNGGYILNEQLYQKGLTNKPLADFITNLEEPATLIMADSAEPKSVAELKLYGLNILGVEKGPDSIRKGISFLQEQVVSVTKSSVNLIREYRGYMWASDKDGNFLREPTKGNEHLLDAARYGMEGINKNASRDFTDKIKRMQQLAVSGDLYS
jgi:phage terminase large subunit